MKLGLVGDIHFGLSRGDSNFFLDYQLKYFNEEVFPKFKEAGVTNILCTGDFFHSRKTIEVYTYTKVKELFLDKLEEYGFTLYVLVGNHDLYYTQSSEITSLSVLSEYNCVKVIRTNTILDFDGFKIGMVPWISNGAELEAFQSFTKTCNCSVLMMHPEFHGYTMVPGIIHQGGLKEDDVRGFELVLCGHFHLKQRNPDSNIFYIGAPYELDFSDHLQEKGIHILDTITHQMEFLKNRRYIHYKVNYDEEHLTELYQILPKLKQKIVKLIVINKKNEKLFASFVYNLEQIGPIIYTIIDTPDTQVGEFQEHYEEQNLFAVIEAYMNEKYDKPERMISVLKKLYQDVTPQVSTNTNDV